MVMAGAICGDGRRNLFFRYGQKLELRRNLFELRRNLYKFRRNLCKLRRVVKFSSGLPDVLVRVDGLFQPGVLLFSGRQQEFVAGLLDQVGGVSGGIARTLHRRTKAVGGAGELSVLFGLRNHIVVFHNEIRGKPLPTV